MLIEGVGLAHFGPNHKAHYEDGVEPATIEGCASIILTKPWNNRTLRPMRNCCTSPPRTT